MYSVCKSFMLESVHLLLVRGQNESEVREQLVPFSPGTFSVFLEGKRTQELHDAVRAPKECL